ncbi:protein lifeguard 1-like [Panonychus citri]|uniref:protein lifeguard 1-like n=1 Tax=Panonychus citri TaxID=50023 RepID=UPI002307B4D3|nr:protein lifeguard 1-like [Panonychus citri]XP_053207730.1 protein lifeguard 1-like [Panonychus citri]
MYGDYNSSMEAGIQQPIADQFDAFSNKSIRLKFIRKVYGILSLQLLVTMGFVLAFTLSEEVKGFALKNSWLLFVALGFSLVSLITLACCGVHRTFPGNLVCLGIFTLSESVMIGFTTAFRRGEIVLYAVIITAAIVLSLTLFAFQTKIDFTAFNGILFVCLMVFMLFGILAIFIKGKIVMLIYSAVGALLFSAYLVIDTQMIVGGSHKLQFSPEDYILGAITLYVDIINIFIHILQLLDIATRS